MSLTVLSERLAYIEWDRNNFLGGGSYGKVYLGTRKAKTTGNPTWGEAAVAVKVLLPPEDELHIKWLMREIEIMARVRHPCLLSLFAWGMVQLPEGPRYIMVSQKLDRALDTLIVDEADGKAPEGWNTTRKYQCLLGITAGMCFLHNFPPDGIIHRDLKPANVLMNADLLPVVTDFGFSRSLEGVSRTDVTRNLGTLTYMAPELVEGTDCHFPVDVYAYAITVYEVLAGKKPFSNTRKDATRQQIQAAIQERRRPKWDGTQFTKS
jgi:serine/threonine protein kinase